MDATIGQSTIVAADPPASTGPSRSQSIGGFFKRNPKMVLGMVMLGSLLAIGFLGPLVVDTSEAAPMSIRPDQSPNRDALLGSDSQGRALLSLLVEGIPLTIKVGFLAGGIGLLIG